MRIDKVLRGNNGYGSYTDYLLNAEPPKERGELLRADGLVVTEGFIDQCAPFDVVSDTEIVDTTRLKRCPFCGCKMKLRRQSMADGRTIRYSPYGQHKHGCQLQFAASAFVGNPTTIEGAVKKWNRRFWVKE